MVLAAEGGETRPLAPMLGLVALGLLCFLASHLGILLTREAGRARRRYSSGKAKRETVIAAAFSKPRPS